MSGCVTWFFTACQNEFTLDEITLKESSVVTSRSLSVDNDSIIHPLNPEDFPQKPETYSLEYDSELSDELYSLNEVKLRIRSANAGNKNTLQNYGKGKEIKLAEYNEGNVDQLFYIKVLPASTGIRTLFTLVAMRANMLLLELVHIQVIQTDMFYIQKAKAQQVYTAFRGILQSQMMAMHS